MSTQVFLVDVASEIHLGTNNAKLDGTAIGWRTRITSTSRGNGVGASSSSTVTGATPGVEIVQSGTPLEWISPPVDQDVTISGDITANLWSSESNMSANVAINVVIEKVDAATLALTQIVKSTRTTEVAVTTRAVNNFTTGMLAADYTDVTLNKGDRLRFRIFGDDAGTMASGFTFDFGFDGTTSGADGDSFITFSETFGFQTTDPTGTVLYPTDTASDVATASVDREMWTSRGGGVQNDVTNTAAGWTAPIQVTDTAGGTTVVWFSKQLQAFTLAGKAKLNLRASESNFAANASLHAELARVDSDGSNATVWAIACPKGSTVSSHELNTAETAETIYLAGDDLALTDGQRLRLRIFVDDANADGPLVTGHTVTTYYAGTSGGASGDTFLTLEQTVAEFVSGVPSRPAFVRHTNADGRDLDPWSLTGFA